MLTQTLCSRSLLLILCACCLAFRAPAQSSAALTPLQQEIENEKQRLTSTEPEERRDALMKLGALKRPEASHVAAGALNDAETKVRVAAAHACVWLPSAEGAALISPLLQDKLEFVRREAAYALGETHSSSAVAPLTTVLANDKEMPVRAAAAIALGEIRDPSSVGALVQALEAPAPKKRAQAYEFVKRAAVEALGKIAGRSVVQPLISALSNESNSADVRRAAATALGMTGDNAAVPSLQAAINSDDPYLADAARRALRRIQSQTR